MPWTFAHPAAVLPLRRYCPRYLNFSALVIGSLSPDLGYYLDLFPVAAFAHSLTGSLLVCLPSGILLLVVLFLLRKPFWFVLPQPHRAALAPLIAKSPRLRAPYILTSSVSILLGAWTHIAWDLFTHKGSWLVSNITSLQQTVFHIGTTPFPLYYLLQQISTLLGSVILLIAYWVWLRGSKGLIASDIGKQTDRWRYALLSVLTILALGVGIFQGLEAVATQQGYYAVRVFLFRTAVDSTSTFAMLLLVCSVLCYAIGQKAPRD